MLLVLAQPVAKLSQVKQELKLYLFVSHFERNIDTWSFSLGKVRKFYKVIDKKKKDPRRKRRGSYRLTGKGFPLQPQQRIQHLSRSHHR
jgi:hypothetical protein